MPSRCLSVNKAWNETRSLPSSVKMVSIGTLVAPESLSMEYLRWEPKVHSLVRGLHVFKGRCVIWFVSFKHMNKIFGFLKSQAGYMVHENYLLKSCLNQAQN